MNPLIVVAEGKAKPGKEDELRARMQSLLAPTRAEEGCIQYDMHESQEQPGVFCSTSAGRARTRSTGICRRRT